MKKVPAKKPTRKKAGNPGNHKRLRQKMLWLSRRIVEERDELKKSAMKILLIALEEKRGKLAQGKIDGNALERRKQNDVSP